MSLSSSLISTFFFSFILVTNARVEEPGNVRIQVVSLIANQRPHNDHVSSLWSAALFFGIAKISSKEVQTNKVSFDKQKRIVLGFWWVVAVVLS